MATLKDIAQETGFSMMTVSRVINGVKGAASEETVRQIQEAVKRLGYIPNAQARSLSSKSSKLIAGILTSEETNPLQDSYNAQFFGALVRESQKQGFDMILCFVRNYTEALNRICTWNTAGAVINGMPEKYIKQFTNKELLPPLVFTDIYAEISQLNKVDIDDAKGGKIAAEYLLKYGHTNVAFLGLKQEDNGLMNYRQTAFCKTYQDKGFPLPSESIFSIPETEEAITSFVDYLSCNIHSITAAFIAADKVAVQVIQRLQQRGLRVPQDISIIGFDGMPEGEIITPRLTTIRQDIQLKAKCAIDILLRHINNPETPAETMTLDICLIERDSVINRINQSE